MTFWSWHTLKVLLNCVTSSSEVADYCSLSKWQHCGATALFWLLRKEIHYKRFSWWISCFLLSTLLFVLCKFTVHCLAWSYFHSFINLCLLSLAGKFHICPVFFSPDTAPAAHNEETLNSLWATVKSQWHKMAGCRFKRLIPKET